MSRYKANMPSVGITSFLKLPIVENFSNLITDVGFLGIPMMWVIVGDQVPDLDQGK